MKKILGLLLITSIIIFGIYKIGLLDIQYSEKQVEKYIEIYIDKPLNKFDKKMAQTINKKLKNEKYTPKKIKGYREKVQYLFLVFLGYKIKSIKNAKKKKFRKRLATNYRELSTYVPAEESLKNLPFDGFLPAINYVSMLTQTNPLKYKHGYIYGQLLSWIGSNNINFYEDDGRNLIIKHISTPEFNNNAEMKLYDLIKDPMDENGCINSLELKKYLLDNLNRLDDFYKSLLEVSREYLITNLYLLRIKSDHGYNYRFTEEGIKEGDRVQALINFLEDINKKQDAIPYSMYDKFLEVSLVLNIEFFGDNLRKNMDLYRHRGIKDKDEFNFIQFVNESFKDTLRKI